VLQLPQSALTTRFGQSHLAYAAARVAIKDQIDNYMIQDGEGVACEITQEWYPANELHDHDFDKMTFQMLWADFQIKADLEDLCTCKRRGSQVQRWKGDTRGRNTIASTLFTLDQV
jgi:hypothetical protein